MWSLVYTDAFLRRNTKSELCFELEEKVELLEEMKESKIPTEAKRDLALTLTKRKWRKILKSGTVRIAGERYPGNPRLRYEEEIKL